MSMPIDLVLIRHGESEGNVASSRSRNGDDTAFSSAFRRRHSSQWRLSDEGSHQAKTTGQWIKKNLFPTFDRFYVSDYLRAQETAALLELPNALWRSEIYLRERNWGDLDRLPQSERNARFEESLLERKTDPFYWRPPNGESVADLCLRLDRELNTWHRECADKRLIAVCHGEVMWGFRIRLERMLPERFVELEHSKDSANKIHNCQVLDYTRRDPRDQHVPAAPHFQWMRSLCPHKGDASNVPWQKIERHTFTNEDLLSRVNRAERLVN